MFGKKKQKKLAQADTRCCLHSDEIIRQLSASYAGLQALSAGMQALSRRIEALERAMRALDAVRLALEAKTWMSYQRRLTGRVKAGCARAASARRDANGRYLPT